ncbi:MAG: archease [Candidatus Omnitrophota bacterium]
MKNYEFLEHTADFGIRVWGKTQTELFTNAATGMFEYITDISKVKPTKTIAMELESDDRNGLLKDWLSELLYYCNVKNMLFCEFKIDAIDDKRIECELKGERIDKSTYKLNHEVKAVTFHNLNIEEKEGLLTTEIIFDV